MNFFSKFLARVFLFSDILIYARPNPSHTAAATTGKQPKLLVSGQLPLEQTILVDVADTGMGRERMSEEEESEERRTRGDGKGKR
jgi:hypothetical protein